MLRMLLLCAAIAMALAPADLLAQEASDWSEAKGAAIRLIQGSAAAGERRAGLEIRLEPGWKTYWRNPGDSGVPPSFDWSQSVNLADVSVSWPAPERLEDEGGTSIGYKHDVLLPLVVRPKDPTQPVRLHLTLDYAVCETICVPVKGEASLMLEPGSEPPPSLAARIEAAEALVPRPEAIGSPAPLSILSVESGASGKPRSLFVTVRAPGEPVLFADGPQDWYLPLPSAAQVPAGSQGTHAFTIELEGLPRSAKVAGTALHLTLTTGDDAIETIYTLP
jgi:DsbC/DsbD-like thiol-disulfide interchange protein